MRYFVFVDLAYYPYVGEPVEADSEDEAMELALAEEGPLPTGATIYLAPMNAVTMGRGHGPERRPAALLELIQRYNRASSAMIEAKHLHGGYSVMVVAD